MAAKTIKAGEAFLELTIRDAQFRKSIDRSISRLQRLGASFKSLGSLGIAGGGLAGLQRALSFLAGSAVLTAPIKLAANLEQAEAAFTALTGSAEAASDIIQGLLRFSGKSQFNFDTLQGAARNMLNFGVAAEQVMPLLEQLGAIAAGDADRLDRLAIAFGQTQAKGRLMAEEVRQMVNAGFNPLQEIARTSGRAMGDLLKDMEAGKISAEQVAQAFASVTGPGGRFAGILKLISNTALGQFRQLAAGIRVAVIPLGQELLPAITGVLKSINALIPNFAQIIRQNASWYKIIIVTSVALAGLLATIFSLGVSMQVVAFSAGGLVRIFSLILNPITLAAAAIGGLTALFVRFTETGRAAFAFLADKFGVLANIAVQTFDAIGEALAGGNITAAANVLWAGLRLAWVEGTSELHRIWIDFKFKFLQVTTDAVFGAIGLWESFKASVLSIWESMVTSSRSVGERIGHWLTRSSDPELAADQDAAHNAAMAAITAEGDARQKAIQEELNAKKAALEGAKRAAEAARKEGAAADIAAAKRAQEEAQRAFDAAREAARIPFPDGDIKGKFGPPNLAIAETAGAAGLGPRSTFSGKLAGQIFGTGGDSVDKQILVVNKKQLHELQEIGRKAATRSTVILVGDA